VGVVALPKEKCCPGGRAPWEAARPLCDGDRLDHYAVVTIDAGDADHHCVITDRLDARFGKTATMRRV